MINLFLTALLCPALPADTIVTLDAVTGQQRRERQMRTSLSEVLVSHEFLRQNFSGSLMQTLEAIPGV